MRNLVDIQLKNSNLSIMKIKLGCGGTLEGPTGVIQSPGYPSGYPHRHICRWNIVGPPGRSIKLEFDGKSLLEIKWGIQLLWVQKI